MNNEKNLPTKNLSGEDVLEKQTEIPAEIIEDILENKDIPPEIKGKLTRVMKEISIGVEHSSIGIRPHNPIADKLTGDHITKILDLNSKEMDYIKDDSIQDRRYNFGYFLISISVFLCLVFYFGDKAFLIDVLKIGLSVLAGMGIESKRKKNK